MNQPMGKVASILTRTPNPKSKALRQIPVSRGPSNDGGTVEPIVGCIASSSAGALVPIDAAYVLPIGTVPKELSQTNRSPRDRESDRAEHDKKPLRQDHAVIVGEVKILTSGEHPRQQRAIGRAVDEIRRRTGQNAMLQNVQEGTKPKACDKRDRKSHGEVEQAKQQTPRPPEHRRQKSRERRYRYKNAGDQSAMHGCSRATWPKSHVPAWAATSYWLHVPA